MATKKVIGAGYRALFYGVVNSSGIFIGSSTTAPAAGNTTGSGMTRLDGARTLPMNIAEPDVLVVSGDDEPKVSFEFDSENLPSGLFEQAVHDMEFEALVQGTAVDESGNIAVGVYDPANRDSQSMCLMLWRISKSWKSGERGAKKWEGLHVPQCTIKPLGNAWEQRTFNGYGYSVNASRADRTAWTTINLTEYGTTGASMLPIASDYPFIVWRFTGNNAVTAFTLPYALVSGGTSRVTLNGVYQALTTNYTLTGTALNFVAAPGSDVVITVIWEVDESVLLG